MNWKEIIQTLLDDGLTQRQVAERVGCSPQMVSRLMVGSSCEVSYTLGTAIINLRRRYRPRKKHAKQ